MKHNSRISQSILVLIFIVASNAQAASAQSTQSGQSSSSAIYPMKGQSQAQQKKDVSACQSWAQEQTGFNPAAALEASQSGTTSSAEPTRRGGAAKGAATGAIIGGIAGDAGKGAAAGAAAGALSRRSARIQQGEEQSQQQAAQDAELNQKIAGFNRATTACLEGRGYSVK